MTSKVETSNPWPPKTNLKLVFDPINAPNTTYGYYRCTECVSEFFGPVPLHASVCSMLRALEYIFGVKAAQTILDGQPSHNPINADTLLQAIPDIRERISQASKNA